MLRTGHRRMGPAGATRAATGRGSKWRLSAICLAALAPLGCAEFMTPTSVTGKSGGSMASQQAVPYNGPKVRVAVMRFDNKSGAGAEVRHSGTTIQTNAANAREVLNTTYADPIGSGMSDMLVTALGQTGAFILVERGALGDVMAEQDLGASGRVRGATAAASGQIEGADFLIYGAVTEYLENQASVAGGVGHNPLRAVSDPTVSAGRIFSQVLAEQAMAAFGSQDHVAIDLRVVDSRTGRIVGTTSIEGKARDLGVAMGGRFGQTLVDFGGQYQTPIQKAVRACAIKGANYIADLTLADPNLIHSSGAPANAATGAIPAGQPHVNQAAPAGLGMTVRQPSALIRLKPSKESMTIREVPRGEKLTVLAEDGEWVRVVYDGDEGWTRKMNFSD